MSEERTIEESVQTMEATREEQAEQGGTHSRRDRDREGETPRRPLTPKRTALVESFLVEPTAATAEHCRRAGYAESTGHNPRMNGLIPRALVPQYIADQEAAGEPSDDQLARLSKTAIAGRIRSGEASESLLHGTYKTASELKANSGEDAAEDPAAKRAEQQTRQELAWHVLDLAVHVARLGARFGERAVAALLARRGELPVRAGLQLDLADLDDLDTSQRHAVLNRVLTEMLSTPYRQSRRRGFALPPAADNRPWQFRAKG